MKSGELRSRFGLKAQAIYFYDEEEMTNARCQKRKSFLCLTQTRVRFVRDLLHLWSKQDVPATLSRGFTTWCQTLVIILDARLVRLQKSNHTEAKDASFIIIMYQLKNILPIKSQFMLNCCPFS